MPKKIRLMTDYGCYPLWWDEPDQVGDLDPESLPLTQETIKRLYNWADAFEARLNLADPSDSPEVKPEEVERFEGEGLSLWKQLNQELAPDYEVVYFSSHFSQIFTDSAKLEEKLKLNLMKFNQISWEDARENITQLFDQVVVNRDIIVINRPEGESVVLMAIEELNDLIATAHLDNKKQTIGKKDY
ncbi:MAG: type II toxin-antitoxin system Phd/YefM family antitoxin [Planktothrix sp.]